MILMPLDLPDYLKSNSARIQALGPQVLPSFGKAYQGWEHPVMQRLYKQFPEFNIQRADVIKLYHQWKDPELALIASMVWGGINATRRQRSGSSPFESLLSHSPEEIVDYMNRIRSRILAKELHQAFLDCSKNGATKFNGVGPSFFTKIFFFIGEGASSLQIKPLIFDKWTQHAFFLLLAEIAGIPASSKYFRISYGSSSRESGIIQLKNGPKTHASAYVEFVNYMNHWSTMLRVSPEQLEHFVFGQSRKGSKSLTENPRNEILNRIAYLV